MIRHRPRLWLAVRLVELPLMALGVEDDPSLSVVVENKQRVVCANAQALKQGVTLGMDITTANMLSQCRVLERDTTKEQTLLNNLSEQLYQFTPHIEIHVSPSQAFAGILLEVSSCLVLFGGVEQLSHKLFDYLTAHHYVFTYGVAHSEKAAWYLSFDEQKICDDDTKEHFLQRINRLPLALLSDYPKALSALTKMGFLTFGDLARQINAGSIASFRKRLGSEFALILRDIYGIDQDMQQSALFEMPRANYRPVESFQEGIQFDFPVTTVEQLNPAFEALLHALTDYLRTRQQQAQAIEWCIADIHHQKEVIKIECDSPQIDWHLFYDLTLIKFDNKELRFEVDVMRLLCKQTIPMENCSHMLNLDQSRVGKNVRQDYGPTLSKLKARLGADAVYKLSYQDNRVPELTNAFIALSQKCNQVLPNIHLKSLRPAWLLSVPEPIRERNAQLFWKGYLSLLSGPERVIGQWWDEPAARDYFLAKRHDNVPVWIYLDLYSKRWFVHGVFA